MPPSSDKGENPHQPLWTILQKLRSARSSLGSSSPSSDTGFSRCAAALPAWRKQGATTTTRTPTVLDYPPVHSLPPDVATGRKGRGVSMTAGEAVVRMHNRESSRVVSDKRPMMKFNNPPAIGYAPIGAKLNNMYVGMLGRGGLRLPNKSWVTYGTAQVGSM